MDRNNFYSTEVDRIMHSASPRVLKWGWGGIFMIFFIIFAGGWLIKYPQTVPYQILLKPTDYSSEKTVGLIIIDAKDSVEFTVGQQVCIRVKYLEKFDQRMKGKVITTTMNQKEGKYDVVIDFSDKIEDLIIKRNGIIMDCEAIFRTDPLIIRIFPALVCVQNIFNGLK